MCLNGFFILWRSLPSRKLQLRLINISSVSASFQSRRRGFSHGTERTLLHFSSSTFKDAVLNLYFVSAIHKLYVGEKECWKHHEPEQCGLKSRAIFIMSCMCVKASSCSHQISER